MSLLRPLLALLLLLMLAGCSGEGAQQKDEAVKAAWSQWQEAGRRRADLLPPLLAEFKVHAGPETAALEAEVEAAHAAFAALNPDTGDATAMRQMQAAEVRLEAAISALLDAAKAYPQLQSAPDFVRLQADIAASRNRTAVARQAYLAAVAAYNAQVDAPWARVLGYEPRPLPQ